MRYDIFLSHCREDKLGVALPLYQSLNSLGFDVWIDRSKIVPGSKIYDSIEYAIGNSVCFIAIISAPYLTREWTRKELELSLQIEQAKIEHGLQKLFPIYHRLAAEQVCSQFPSLKGRAFEKLETECFNIENPAERSILDRVILWYFKNLQPTHTQKNWNWLNKYCTFPHISQLLQLFQSVENPSTDLRASLIAYTNIIRYLLAILVERELSMELIHLYDIARKYCADIADMCFSFQRPVTYDMLLACETMVPVLCGHLKALLDSPQDF